MDSNNQPSHPPIAPLVPPAPIADQPADSAAPVSANAPVNMAPEARQFLEQLLKDANIFATDPATREEIMQEMYVKLDEFIAMTIVNSLSKDKLEEFTRLNAENKSKDDMEKYLKANIPNVQEVMAKAFTDFREMYLNPDGIDNNDNSPLAPLPKT